jgi:hypothetical protein
MIANFLRGLVSRLGRPTAQFGFGVAQRFSAAINASFFSRALAPEVFQRTRRHAFCLTLIGIVIPPCAFLFAQNSRPSLAPITRGEVWQAVTVELRQRGVREEQLLRVEEIELPAAVPAAGSRTLRVSMVCWDADLERAQFQLECREPGQCIPFLAYANAGRSTAMGSEKIAGSSCRSPSRPRTATSAARKDVIRVGDRATVAFHGSHLHMTALVTCLERGAEGAIIRVRNRDGQIFRARVSAPARLEALTE